jgi:uncharacterized glyoxalase superfamily protein PhnB
MPGAGPPLISMEPGSIRGLHLVVKDIDEARRALIRNGVYVAEIDDQGGGGKYAGLADADGNSWTLQEMVWRSEASA